MQFCISKEDEAYIRDNIAIRNARHGECGPVSLQVQEYLEGRGYAHLQRIIGRVFPRTNPQTWDAQNRTMLKSESQDGGLPHIWIDLDGQIIDATASQFGEQMLLVLTEEDPRYRWYAYPPEENASDDSEETFAFRPEW